MYKPEDTKRLTIQKRLLNLLKVIYNKENASIKKQ